MKFVIVFFAALLAIASSAPADTTLPPAVDDLLKSLPNFDVSNFQKSFEDIGAKLTKAGEELSKKFPEVQKTFTEGAADLQSKIAAASKNIGLPDAGETGTQAKKAFDDAFKSFSENIGKVIQTAEKKD
ncbi:hypothetical protein QAD02_005447 [Eretmocerus hayati]|uniref:Uncharacterized protein n=1 Tax=Eretmocerus hayati TaxID=131215 RepID=A0ACC2NSC4_9HYME|nr:hypothetical protein QAD02_005447 [Eretmocerus hayati]